MKEKKGEMDGLKNAVIRVGTFTSVSRTFLPQLMRGFKSKYPDVQFELLNGEYNSIDQWIREGTVDFGFINTLYANGLTVEPLYHNVMGATEAIFRYFYKFTTFLGNTITKEARQRRKEQKKNNS